MDKLKIYFTSDVHGYVFPTDYRDRTDKPMGLLNIMEEFQKDGNTLIIDGGDTIQGSPFVSYISKNISHPHPMAKVMNEAGYDYIALGNHDFNYGESYLKQYLKNVKAKCLCTNITDLSGEIEFLPYDIKQMENGIVVGLIGFTTDFITTWEKPEHIKNFEIKDTYSSIGASVEKLRNEVDVLIGIYHGGFEYDLDTHRKLSETKENIAYTICRDFDFDILLTGHQHMDIGGQWLHGTYIAQTPENGRKYIEMEISLENKKIKEVNSSSKIPTINPNKKLYEELLSIENTVQNWLDDPVGFLDIALQPDSHIEMALKGSYLANFINQIQLDISEADLSCTSFANSVKGFNSSVTIRDIVSTYIYPNTLVVLEITGEDLLMALERCGSYFNNVDGEITVSDLFLKPKVEHYNYDYFSNLYYSFDLTKPVGERVVSALFKGEEVREDQTLTLVMNNYRASGAGGYDFYKKGKVVKEILIEMPEIIINYFQKHKEVTVDKTQYIGDAIL